MPNNTKKEECVPGEFILTSIPVQYRCRNCGKTWFSSEKTPECSAPQSPLSEEKKGCKCGCNGDANNRYCMLNHCSEECVKYNDVSSPSSNENWEIEFDAMFDWAEQIKQKELDRWIMMYGFIPNDLKEFVRQQRLEAQCELAEEIMSLEQYGGGEQWGIDVELLKQFFTSKGLLPKITE